MDLIHPEELSTQYDGKINKDMKEEGNVVKLFSTIYSSMDASVVNPPLLPDPSDEGLFQKVRDLHVLIENYLKALPVNEECIAESVDAIVGQDCPLPVKFSKVNVVDLIKKNKNIKGSESLATLVSALGLLEKYGRNLMKPERPKLWKFINFANSVFRTRVDIIKGARELLQLMGYSEVVEDGLSFPLDVESPHMDTVATITADLAIIKRETELYNQGNHPHAYRFKDCLDGTMAMVQVPSDSPTGRPQSVFMRLPSSGARTIYENFDILQPPLGSGVGQLRLERDSSEPGVMPGSGYPSNTTRAVPTNKPKQYTSSVNPASQIDGVVHKIGEPIPPPRRSHPNGGFAYFANSPESQSSTLSTSQPASQLSPQIGTTVPLPLNQQPDLTIVSDQGKKCVMCDKSTANMQCSTCSGLRCESCDNKWHMHPTRRAHKRQVLTPCHVCGIQSSSVFCTTCSSSTSSGMYCSNCDMMYHGHPLRQDHSREPLGLTNPIPAVKAPPTSIVLSPVNVATPSQDPLASTEASSAAKKRPIPAPRSFRSKSPVFTMPSEPLIPEGQGASDDVFTTVTRSDIRKPSKRLSAQIQSDSTIEGVSDDPLSPKPYHSLPSSETDIMSETEALVQKDIGILKAIRKCHEAVAICDTSSPEYRSLQMQISSLLSEHNRLRRRQTELENIVESTASSPEVAEKVGEQPSMVKAPSAKDYPQSPTNQPSNISTPRIMFPPGEMAAPSNVTRVVVTAADLSRLTNQNSHPANQNSQSVGAPFTYQGPTLAVSMTNPAVVTKPSNKQIPTVTSAPTIVPQKYPEVTPSQTRASFNTTSAIQPGKVQQIKNNINSASMAPVGTTVKSNQVPAGAWVCLQCGNHNTADSSSTICMTCLSPMPVVTSQKPSVAALSQQLLAAIPMPVSPKTKPITQTEPMNVFTYLQLEEEAMLKVKQKAQEEYEKQLASQSQDETKIPPPPPKSPSPMPRIKHESKKNEATDSLTSSTKPQVAGTNQGALYLQPLPKDATPPPQPVSPSRFHPILAEDKRRLDEQRAQSLDFIKTLRKAADAGYFPEEVVFASEQIEGNQDQTIKELQWLDGNWENYIATVTAMATNILQKEIGKSVGMVRKQEARKALRKHYGNVEKAVEECVSEMQRKVVGLADMGFSHKRICHSLSMRNGGVEKALAKLQQERAADFISRIWLAEDTDAQEKSVIDLGVDRHPDTVERRLRILLAEYDLPSWGRATTAVTLIDTGKYNFNDALTAASECGDIERATQYLEKECKVCYSQFAMNKLSTLIHCQCMICLECLHGHFEIVVNNRNILNANCPACDKPDLRGSDLDTTADYFGFLDILLKGILDPGSYQLFQDKMRDLNLMKEDNFRWCAHCGNGFINEAPNRRKMRCNECNKLTCFQCKKPWMDQHENITCAEFQAWKEANDPNRAAQGLAIHLKENGIDCPHCKMRYELAKGGCMHFKCGQCTHEFCCGCSSPFKKTTDCGRFASCLARGLHAHHPRDCLFYLRDLEVKALQKLLQKHKVDYKRDNPGNQQLVCSVMEQKELPDGLKDDQCGREAVHAGLCNLHYKEYLVSQINQNHIDPADEYGIEELTIILHRNEFAVPARPEREAEGAYKARLLQEVKANLPLEKKIPRDRAQSM